MILDSLVMCFLTEEPRQHEPTKRIKRSAPVEICPFCMFSQIRANLNGTKMKLN